MSSSRVDKASDNRSMVSLAEQIACVQRELTFRRRLYPRWVTDRKISQAKADAELRAMEAVLISLLHLVEE